MGQIPVAENTETRYWLALKRINGLGNTAIRSLIDHFSSVPRLFEASSGELSQIPGIKMKTIDEFKRFNDWESVEQECKKLAKIGGYIVTYQDPEFPTLLKNIDDYPAFLYVKGTLHPQDVNIAIVGSRRATSYGLLTAEKLSRDLVHAGITIVSGMARGIDAAAHRGAIAARGRTMAVLGSGLDVVYPPEHRDLYTAISTQGAVISEFSLGTPPRSTNFPYRNRLISGMSWGVVVVEATDKSGSLITAHFAAEQGRGVFAVPGEIDSPGSRGTHKLLKDGATIVERVEDILEEIRPQLPAYTPILEKRAGKETPQIDAPVTEREAQLLSLLGRQPVHRDTLMRESGLSAPDVLSTLLTLELKGIITKLPGQYYIRKG